MYQWRTQIKNGSKIVEDNARILFPIEQLDDAGEQLLQSLVDDERELVDPLSEDSACAAWAQCL